MRPFLVLVDVIFLFLELIFSEDSEYNFMPFPALQEMYIELDSSMQYVV